MNARRTALSLLVSLEEKECFANLLLSDRLLAQAEEDAPFLTALFYGCVERRITLDYAIAAFAKRQTESLSSHTRNLLRLGLYQLYFMRIPPHAAVSQTVALGEDKSERALLNGVLRHACETPLPLPPENRRARHLSVKYAFPLSTVRHFISLFGEEDTEKLLSAFNRVSPLKVTVNTTKISQKELLARLQEAGYEASSAKFSPYSICFKESVSPTRLPGFSEGLFFVQDEASCLACDALGAQAGDTVIDVCSAPGGKILGAAVRAEGKGRFIAYDLYESKLSLIKESAKRLGLSLAVSQRDATCAQKEQYGLADKVICDVPCSGLGVLGKKPDLRYRAREAGLADLGYTILCESEKYLKEGGVLLFATCTIAPDENEQNVERFLKSHPNFSREDFVLGGGLQSENGMLQLLPHIHGTDGFFIAKLRKGKT